MNSRSGRWRSPGCKHVCCRNRHASASQQQFNRASTLEQRLHTAGRNRVERIAARLRVVSRALDAVGPQATLDRGYAIVTDADKGTLITDAARVSTGARIAARLASGEIAATVTGTNEDDS